MNIVNITIKISLKEPIVLMESSKFLEKISIVSNRISGELRVDAPQLLSLPFNDAQPAEIPFAIYQAPGQYSVVLSRNSLTISIDTEDNLTARAIKAKLNNMLDAIFEDKRYVFLDKEISGISVLIATSIFGVNEGYICDFVKNAKIEDLCSINQNGFYLKYTNRAAKDTSSETTSFASIIKDNEELGIQVAKEFSLGGFDIKESTPTNIRSGNIEKFIAFLKSNNFDSRIETAYGLSRIE